MLNKELYKREGNKVYIKQPNIEELSFVEKLWGNINNMNNVGKTYAFPKDKWEMFYKVMVYPTDKKNFYCLIYNYNNEAVGEVSFHGYNSLTKVARINVKIDYKYRRLGYAKEALQLLLEYYFWDFGGETIIDSVNNEESSELLKSIGFEVVNKFKDQITYKLEKNKFSLYEKNKIKFVNVISYDDMDIMDYSLIITLFKKANSYLKEEYFKINLLSVKESVIIDNKIQINIDNEIENLNSFKGICIIPGSCKDNVINEDLIFYKELKKNYKDLDHIISFYDLKNNSLISEQMNLINIEHKDMKKITTAFTYKEKISSCINIIKKNLGEKIAENLVKELL